MNATHSASLPSRLPAETDARPAPMIGLLRALLLGEAVLMLGLAVFLSVLAPAINDFLGGDAGRDAEQNLRFVAGFAFVFAILAAVGSRGARRRRSWSWTLAALLQLVLAVGTGIATLTTTWHPAYLGGFVLAAVVMLVLSSASVRRALGQD